MELYTWEYEGKKEFGVCVNRYCATGKREFRWLNGAITRWEDSITNLRSAKVVDADAVVFNNQHPILVGNTRLIKGDYTEIVVQVHRSEINEFVKTINPTPPVTEPTGFGAIVEAGWYNIQKGIEPKGRFFFNGRDWILEGTLYNFVWRDLINPTILSEGLK